MTSTYKQRNFAWLEKKSLKIPKNVEKRKKGK
jgi:hypothetical protein